MKLIVCLWLYFSVSLSIIPAERLHGFVIGVTDVDPSLTAPTVGEYDVCAQHVGAAGATTELTL